MSIRLPRWAKSVTERLVTNQIARQAAKTCVRRVARRTGGAVAIEALALRSFLRVDPNWEASLNKVHDAARTTQ